MDEKLSECEVQAVARQAAANEESRRSLYYA